MVGGYILSAGHFFISFPYVKKWAIRQNETNARKTDTMLFFIFWKHFNPNFQYSSIVKGRKAIEKPIRYRIWTGWNVGVWLVLSPKNINF